MYVYADLVIMINLAMNTMILLLTAVAAGIGYKFWRVLLAAALGGIYALGGVMPELSALYTAGAKLVASLFLIGVAFGFKSSRLTLLLTGIFYVISFILGGAVIGWLFFWESNGIPSMGLVSSRLATWQLAAGSMLGTGLIVWAVRWLAGILQRQRTFHRLQIGYQGRTVELVGMLDTGNSVFSLIGHKPVIIVETQSVLPLFSQEVQNFLASMRPELWLSNLPGCQDQAWLNSCELIFYKGVGSSGMLLGFRPDWVAVCWDSGYTKTTAVVIGLYSGNLDSDNRYQALLHPMVLQGSTKQGEVKSCASPGQLSS